MIARAEAPRRDASKPAAVDVDDVRRRSVLRLHGDVVALEDEVLPVGRELRPAEDRKSTRLNSSHGSNSYAGFRLKKKKESKTLHTSNPKPVPRNNRHTPPLSD